MRGRFANYIECLEASDETLPLLHTTSAYNFVEICEGENLDPVHCEVFDADLLYLFYGRPAYRTGQSVDKRLKYNWPFSFIIDPQAIRDIRAVYPFDTGAFSLGLYEGFFDKRSKLHDFELPGDLEVAQKLVHNFYGSSERYFEGEARLDLEVPLTQFEAQGVHALAGMPLSVQMGKANFKRDERSNSIELQLDNKINICGSVLGLIAPRAWQLDAAFLDAVQRWGVEDKVLYYEISSVDEGNNWVSQLYEQVRNFRRIHDDQTSV